MALVGALTFTVLLALCFEALLIRSRIRSIPIRVHVGGTRGKSSVTRYVAAALRRDGHRVLAKITGIRPTILAPDGTEQRIRRRGPARVQEQLRMLRQAHLLGCDAIVLECMSVVPALQRLESRLLEPTLSVLTNVLDDHREEYGPTPGGRLAAYAEFLPVRGVVVSGEQAFAPEIERLARERGTRVVVPGSEELSFASPLHAEGHHGNLLLALTASRVLGIAPSAARPAIEACCREQGSALITKTTGEGEIRFLNAFAVNDVPSTEAFLEEWRQRLGGWQEMTVLLNTRADRPHRSLQFARWCAGRGGVRAVILTGPHAPRTGRELRAAGFPPDRITVWGRREVRDPVRALGVPGRDRHEIVVGVGNIAGDGIRILEGLRS